ncbi:hypothetical protein WFI_00021 [Escherichia phage vB_EcoS_WFI]|uniref:Putative DnaT-like domain-containing protein n=2 Tax=Dhillonvirus TaxID=1623289 RepID=A0AAE7XVT0_9CAUD|nr:hypothetical protein P9603_gp21 [Escherichia phage vB_EcoS_WFI]YP_010740878.1 hypothetical protein P9606_gp22 [Escherichia phage vB_EcoS-101114BS4]QZI78384.1 hypothetical protein 22664B1_025 [Escherichia phage vB_EcoS-22664B1]QZI79014.1 hypothetical protein 101114B2_024 [Escherichia phage vB_EcoS-101114B2]USL86304.1 hypothetical protein CHD2B1_048 [Escherichia phage vB_EcoS-CHD2B1]QBQ80588.1 hypothetical protein WFI_00021 [Escherichia phage vB_EcoS_WFI]QZI79082.1 hypothetical protein 10111
MYGDPQTFTDYAAARGVEITLGDATRHLTIVNDFLNGLNWIGEQADQTGIDAWPRINYPSDGKPVRDTLTEVVAVVPAGQIVDFASIPVAVEQAVYRLALLVADDIDISPIGGGKETIRETVGPITMEYDPATIGGYVAFPWWDGLLGYWVNVDGNASGNFDVYRG